MGYKQAKFTNSTTVLLFSTRFYSSAQAFAIEPEKILKYSLDNASAKTGSLSFFGSN